MKPIVSWMGCLFLAACGPRLIPGLEIEVPDTPDHRQLIAVMEKFQQAYEQKDVEGIVQLASRDFFDTCGTADTADDYDLEGLRRHFTEHFQKLEKPALTITLKEVKIENDQATIDYHFLARYQMKLPSGDRWQVTDDLQRMKLVRENGTWKVVSGF